MLDVHDDLGHFTNFVSMLSTIKLQLNAFQAVTQPASNWLHGIWSMLSAFHCESDVVAIERLETAEGVWFQNTASASRRGGVSMRSWMQSVCGRTALTVLSRLSRGRRSRRDKSQ